MSNWLRFGNCEFDLDDKELYIEIEGWGAHNYNSQSLTIEEAKQLKDWLIKHLDGKNEG